MIANSISRPPVLQIWLAILSGIATLACLKALFLPPWPKAQPLDQVRINPLLLKAGLKPTPLRSQPGHRNEGVAISQALSWRLQGTGTVLLATVNVRRWEDFQLAWITKEVPNLRLHNRRLNTPVSGVASGLLQGRSAIQTCLVPQGLSSALSGVTLVDLQNAVDSQPISLRDRLATVLGARRSKELQCLLVSLQSSSSASPPSQSWQRLIFALQKGNILQGGH